VSVSAVGLTLMVLRCCWIQTVVLYHCADAAVAVVAAYACLVTKGYGLEKRYPRCHLPLMMVVLGEV
jgi:hypothetical protein